ncbi:malate synthase G [Candidatus Thioglobus sp. NP1]|uniref:malate synthase G n=1 Tax=Candidatus Thioglobus sp. NP1 TaxID=2508687 RepID=UPI000DED4736|nr:malate synthase G [Candidatus Thioglobus sp. NP1]AXE62248.1 malate synthase G [Candidatus Thioglobus sp. NP1]
MSKGKHNFSNICVESSLFDFIDKEACNGLDIKAIEFFKSLSDVINELQKDNIDLLKKRDDFQSQIDKWHIENKRINPAAYKAFLTDIGYITSKPEKFSIKVDDVDPEISQIAGPQLVVPITNQRFVLNAVNARWGSLFDSLYGTNVIPNKGSMSTSFAHNLHRVNKTAELACDFLDEIAPLKSASYRQITSQVKYTGALIFNLNDGEVTSLINPEQYRGLGEDGSILLKNNNLHIEIVCDQEKSLHKSGIFDVILESAITTIVDFEDSASTVSDDEKIHAYRNYLGLMKGDLNTEFIKGGETLTRSLNPDKRYKDSSGKIFCLSGTSLTLVRNVGIHMFSQLVTNKDGTSVPEGILDAMITSLIALHDLKIKGNSKKGSFYIVKPKLHGPEEVRFTMKLFSLVEKALSLKENTLKIGVMDEERRTSINLMSCIHEAKNRIIFINTGFLDRTGDEIHTSMMAGAMRCKNLIKEEAWYSAYEPNNVNTGLNCGLFKKAQIGKGMWAQPDQMREMLDSKMVHLEAGANCSWVPSPTAATLHATHYHRFDVFKCQKEFLLKPQEVNQDDLLVIPFLKLPEQMSEDKIIHEINNNAQSILGYVVKWINNGIGCSKVQDINHIGLMEDRATLRISSQHMANWLHHKICSKEQVNKAFQDMALVVDDQNKHDRNYIPLAPKYDSFAYQASLALAFEGMTQPNGYTEEILIKYRRKFLES